MSAIQVYQFQAHAVRVAVADPDHPEWVARDVCDALELRGNDPLGHLDDDEKGSCTVGTPGGPQEMATVTEAGLYSLILRSRKPAAKSFRRWVTHEVLPSIRRTGSYGAPALDLAAVAGAVAAILLPQVKALLGAPMATQPTIGEAEGARLNRALTQIGKAMHLGCPEKSAASWRQVEVLELREAVDHWGAWADLPAGKAAPAWRWTERRKAKVSNITGPRRQGALFSLQSKGAV